MWQLPRPDVFAEEHPALAELFHRRDSRWACREHPDAAAFRVHPIVDLPELDDFDFDEIF
jgi:hypothetical protein